MEGRKRPLPEESIFLTVAGNMDVNMLPYYMEHYMEKRSPLQKLMQAYSDRIGMPLARLLFSIFDKPIYPSDTAERLGLVAGDHIDVVIIGARSSLHL